MKIQPMSEDRIKYHLQQDDFDDREVCLILAWIEQKAIVQQLSWRPMSYQEYYYQMGVRKINPHYQWTDADWIASVKTRIGYKDNP